MAEKKQFRAIKGVRDILPPESAAWNRVEQTAREVFEAYGYGEIRLPMFEETELFARSVGADTDIVTKEMFPVADAPLSALERDRLDLLETKAELFPNPAKRTDYLLKVDVFLGFLQDAAKKDRFSYEGQETVIETLFKLHEGASSRTSDRSVIEVGAEDWSAHITELKRLLGRLDLHVDMCLRPEATASVCRAYIEHGMQTRPGNVKLYYIGPMFRRERPQKGRYRQFWQIGAEVLGQSDAPAIDAELIEMLLHFFARVGLGEVPGGEGQARGPAPTTAPASGLTLYYNSIGCRECRPKYVMELKAALQKVRDELGPDSQRRIETNPLRVLDSKVESEQAVIEKLPRIGEDLCETCREHFAALKQQFAMRGIEGVENWRLVRGLDYYTRTTFEITAPGLGSQNAVCGGGRYDGLVELLGGPPTKGIGFAIGTDRVMLSLEQQGELPKAAGCDVYVAWMGAAAQAHAIRLARKLRDAGFAVEVPAEEMKFRKSLDLANRLGARYALIIGENEIVAGRYALKRLADAVQRELTEGELIEFLNGERKVASG